MKKTKYYILFLPVFIFGLSSVFAQTSNNTDLSKEVLKERLSQKKVEFVEEGEDQLNPLLLEIKLVTVENQLKFRLNGKKYKLDELIVRLKEVSKERRENGIFLEGTERVDMRITLAARKFDILSYRVSKISAEDFERLVDALKAAGFTQIIVDLRNQT